MLRRALGKLRDGLVSLAYPEICRVCGEMVESWTDGVTCQACWNDPQKTCLFSNKPVCDRCGTLEPIISGAGSLCGMCGEAPFFAARACGVYTGTLEASILFLKTHPHLCARLRSIVAGSIVENREALAADLLIPIPLARSRKRERGYNQASVIAKTIFPVSGIPLDERSLIRARYTERHRAGMDARDRARSLRRAFKVVRPEAVRGAAVLLVDDLFTTGSTAASAAAALLEAGATRVSLFTIARVAAKRTVYIQ